MTRTGLSSLYKALHVVKGAQLRGLLLRTNNELCCEKRQFNFTVKINKVNNCDTHFCPGAFSLFCVCILTCYKRVCVAKRVVFCCY